MLQRIVLLIALALSLSYFFVRGPARALKSTRTLNGGKMSIRPPDFPTLYASAKAWFIGGDPFDNKYLESLLPHVTVDQRLISGSINTPASFPLVTILILFPFHVAQWLWIGLDVLLAVMLMLVLAKLTGISIDRRWLCGFAAFVFALAPIHTSSALGQTSIAVTACIVFCLKYHMEGRETTAGILLGIALALKPQMAVMFLLFHVVCRHWKLVSSAAAVSAVSAAIGFTRLALARVDWQPTYSDNLRSFTQGPGAVTGDNVLMLNAHVPLSFIVANAAYVHAIVILIGALALTMIMRLNVSMPSVRETTVLLYSCVSCLTPLVAYSRFYTASLLVIPLAWAVSALYYRGFSFWPFTIVLLIIPFLVPGTAMLLSMASILPAALRGSILWRCFVLPHETYVLTALLVLLLTYGFKCKWELHHG
jgi:hypothetical protein